MKRVMSPRFLAHAALSALVLLPAAAGADDRLPELLGQPRVARVLEKDTLVDVAVRHRVGFEQLARLNPGVKVWIPEPGTEILLPTEFAPPAAAPHGLVVNLPEMRLYDFSGAPEPEVFSIAIGDEVDPSPTGSFRVAAREVHPAWEVPAKIRAERPELPAVMKPGPENPLGSRWLALGGSTYGLHGTNTPYSIGRLSTHGCIRLYEEDVQRLYQRTRVGAPVTIVYQTVKFGRRGPDIYVEAHPDWYGREQSGERLEQAYQRLGSLDLVHAVNHQALRRALEEARGGPIRIGTLPGDNALEVATSKPDA